MRTPHALVCLHTHDVPSPDEEARCQHTVASLTFRSKTNVNTTNPENGQRSDMIEIASKGSHGLPFSEIDKSQRPAWLAITGNPKEDTDVEVQIGSQMY